MAVLYFKYIRLSVVLLFSVALMSACNKEFLTERSPADATPEKGLVSIHYEAENLTYQELGDPVKATAIDKIRAMAKATRSQINIEIYEDGTSDWRLEKMTSKHDVRVNDQTPPNTSPQTKVTRIARSGYMSFYSSDGHLLSEQDMPVRSFSELVRRIRQDPSAAYTVIGVKTREQVARVIAEGQLKGAIVQDLGNGNVSIRSVVTKTAVSRAREMAATYTSVDIVNQDLGILVGSSLYNDKNQLVNQVFYRYKVGDGKTLMPEAIHQKSWTTNAETGETYATVSTTYFDNVSAIINHN